MHDDVYFYSELTEILSDIESKTNITNNDLSNYKKRLYSVFYEFIFFILRHHSQFFPSNYSRLIFIINNYPLEESLKRKILLVYSFLSKKKSPKLTKSILLQLLSFISDIFEYFLNKPKPVALMSVSLEELEIYKYFKFESDEKLKKLRNVVVESTIPETNLIICYNEINKIEIDCSKGWKEIPKVASQGTLLNCYDLEIIDEYKFATTDKSLVVISPDYLYDITDIAQCFSHKGANAYYYFINKYFPGQTTYYLFLGNLVNQILDYLLLDDNISFEDVLNKAISKKILSYLVLKRKDVNFVKNISEDLKEHFQTLLKVVDAIKKYSFQIEPTFFSAEYGLIGRMDILLESSSDSRWKTIIELKSGNPPTNYVNININNNGKVPSVMWASHYAQIIGYNLILDSVLSNRLGSSMILYSRDPNKPLREASSTYELKKEFVKVRNWVYLLEMQLAKGKFNVLSSVRKLLEAEEGSFIALKNYFDLLDSAPSEVSLLVKEYIRFILNENISAKIGENGFDSRSSQSSLWNVSIENKSDLDSALVNLKLSLSKSDFERDYLFFERNPSQFSITSLRKGDSVVVYHPKFIQNELAFQLFKGVVKQIEPEFVIVSLRNKFSDFVKLDTEDGWIVEKDYIESNTRYLYHSLFNFLLMPKDKMDFFLGKKPPLKTFHLSKQLYTGLYSEEIRNAIEYSPYYLIIGPPGTGKTRIVIKELLKYYLNYTNSKILVCTYTNRAVDEIAEILVKENFKESFLRIGSKEASDFKNNMLAFLAEELPIDELESRIESSRIFLGTAFSFLATPEIFELNKFDVAIVDEASQLLFPHLAGIISSVDKIILVGDEKQLPAVVLQNKSQSRVGNNLLKELGYDDFSISYFEFLLNRNRKQNWNDSIGILDQQSRMHPSVLAPINNFFYGGVISTNPNRFTNDSIFAIISHIQNYFNANQNLRLLFVDVPLERRKKSNIAQAEIIANLINDCYSRYPEVITDKTFGIISPFRVQNSEIYSRIIPELRKVVSIDTIERFQGSEREVILLSLPFNYSSEILLSSNVITQSDGKIIDRKLNVALSRAKEMLLVFGNFNLLSSHNYYKEFLENFFDNSNIFRINM